MAQTINEFQDALIEAMVNNSRYEILAGSPMPSDMVDEMEDSMRRLALPIWQMTASWALGLEGDEFPDQWVKMTEDDPISNYLGEKIDDDTIKYNATTFKLYVNRIPTATSSTVGGVIVGAQPYLYMNGNSLMLNAETSPLLVGGNDMIPTSRAVKLYVDSVLTALGGGGDMLKSTYDTNDDGVVDDAERLGNQLPSYYLAWANITGKPTTISGYAISDAYTISQIDAFFEGEYLGKKQVDWVSITNKPTIPSAESTFISDINVALADGKNIGKYLNGETIPASGKTAVQVLLDLAVEYLEPFFSSFSISGESTTVEVGTTLSGSKTFVWVVDEQSGQVDYIDIYDITDSSNIATNTDNDWSEVVTINTIQLNTEGATQSWRGVGHDITPDPDEDFNSSAFTVTARFYRFYGPTSAFPTDSATVRALSSSAFQTTGDTFILNTGSTYSKFSVCLPPGHTIIEVIDLDALGAVITSEYVQVSNIDVYDAGSTARSYNIYEMEMAIPYTENHRHQITTG